MVGELKLDAQRGLTDQNLTISSPARIVLPFSRAPGVLECFKCCDLCCQAIQTVTRCLHLMSLGGLCRFVE